MSINGAKYWGNIWLIQGSLDIPDFLRKYRVLQYISMTSQSRHDNIYHVTIILSEGSVFCDIILMMSRDIEFFDNIIVCMLIKLALKLDTKLIDSNAK